MKQKAKLAQEQAAKETTSDQNISHHARTIL